MDSLFADLQEGSTWHRCALQINPFSYLATNSKAHGDFTDEESYNSALIAALLEADILVIAITDHWCVDTGEALRAAATAAGITVFPGFEATTKDGVHLLVLFEPATSATNINRRIGECGIPADCKESRPGSLDTLELLETSVGWEAVVVAPHVTTGGGLLEKLSGQTAINAWTSSLLHAVALGGVSLNQAHRGIIENKTLQYKRSNPLAVLSAADVSHPDDVKKPGSSCWIKLSSKSLVGLDLAFRTPQTRVSRTDPSTNLHSRFVGISWEGGFLDGTAIKFNESLNVLIGGRGSGKSTVLESLRYVLGLVPLSTWAKEQHETTVANVLGSGTKIHLEIELRKPSSAFYTVERTIGNSPVVREGTGNIVQIAPADLLKGTEVYGQRELAELAHDPASLTHLLAQYLPDSNNDASNEALEALSRSREDITRARGDVLGLETRLEQVPTVEERLAQFETAGVAEKLSGQERAQREQGLLDRALTALGVAAPTVPEVETEFLAKKSCEGLPDEELLKKAREALYSYNAATRSALESLTEAHTQTKESISKIRDSWSKEMESQQKALNKILRELQPNGVDGAEYLKLKKDLEFLLPLKAQLEEKKQTLENLAETRNNLLTEKENLRTTRLQDLKAEAKKVGRRLKRTVQASVRDGEDRTPLLDLVNNRIPGRTDLIRDVIRTAPLISPRTFVVTIRSGAEAILETYPSISSSQATSLANAPEAVLMELEEVDLPISTDLELNVGTKSEPTWRKLGRLSTGQKATALLLLLMHRGDGPLVIDQPEDDLDNRFIYEDVVPKLRETKGTRQAIFSSHNANIPVLGDADQIVALAAEDGDHGVVGRIVPDGLGSIDHVPVRLMVEELLEGGRDAFNERRYLYGF